MFRRQYYCYIAGLPDLMFDEGKFAYTLASFKEELKDELHPSDYQLVHHIFLPYDHLNLIEFLRNNNEDFDPLGNYSPEDFRFQINNLDAILPEPDRMEKYLADFIALWFDENTDRTRLDPEYILTSAYFDHSKNVKNEFLQDWLKFDRTLRNIVTAVNCRKFKLEIAPAMIGLDEIVQQLVRNPARDFGLSSELDNIEKIIQICELPDILEREKRLDLLRWDYLDEHSFFHYFDIEKILAYLLRLTIALRWLRLDRTAGQNIFRELLKKMEKSYQFPEEFQRKK